MDEDLRFVLTVTGKAGEKRVDMDIDSNPPIDECPELYNSSGVGTVVSAVLGALLRLFGDLPMKDKPSKD